MVCKINWMPSSHALGRIKRLELVGSFHQLRIKTTRYSRYEDLSGDPFFCLTMSSAMTAPTVPPLSLSGNGTCTATAESLCEMISTWQPDCQDSDFLPTNSFTCPIDMLISAPSPLAVPGDKWPSSTAFGVGLRSQQEHIQVSEMRPPTSLLQLLLYLLECRKGAKVQCGVRQHVCMWLRR